MARSSMRVIFRVPLFRLLAVNLAIGTAVAVLLVGGLTAFNLYGLRDLIVADHSPATALGLLLFGLFVTFGSTAMGTAIMALGSLAEGGHGDGGGTGGGGGDRGGGGRFRPVTVPAAGKRHASRANGPPR